MGDVFRFADASDRDGLRRAAAELLEVAAESPGRCLVMSLTTKPGAMALAVMPCRPSWRASDLVKPMRPAFALP